jgi:hypothetical protein
MARRGPHATLDSVKAVLAVLWLAGLEKPKALATTTSKAAAALSPGRPTINPDAASTRLGYSGTCSVPTMPDGISRNPMLNPVVPGGVFTRAPNTKPFS